MVVLSMVGFLEDNTEDLTAVTVEVPGLLEVLMEDNKPQEPLTEDTGSHKVDHMDSRFLEVRELYMLSFLLHNHTHGVMKSSPVIRDLSS